MTGNIDETGVSDPANDELSDEISDEVSDDDIVLSTDDEPGGSTEEINVEALVAKIDLADAEEAARKREIREKLEALNEQRDDKFGTTYNFDIDEDL